ncbi:MAG: hypothetical protein JO297_05430 [Nitrososphaeraceae archaeon]|nr:hypothetical protein [Nitrososphaeraceae archaeon]
MIANNDDPHIFSINSKPYGSSYSDWCIRWIKWLLEQPRESNPAIDTSGENCAQNQHGPVWFLAGTFGGSATRKCNIPLGKAILFPIIEKECSFAEDNDLKIETDLISRTTKFMNSVTHLELSIDGITLQNLNKYRVQTPVFDLMFPRNNVYGVKEGKTRSTCNGFWIFLGPPTVGDHKIYFRGADRDFNTEVTYYLVVSDKKV